MELVLHKSDFVNDKFTQLYGGNREALFTIVDEEFPGNNTLGRVNKIVIMVRELSDEDVNVQASIQSSVIGFGNRTVGVRSSVPELRGEIMTQHNMEQCTVVLYEDESGTT